MGKVIAQFLIPVYVFIVYGWPLVVGGLIEMLFVGVDLSVARNIPFWKGWEFFWFAVFAVNFYIRKKR